MMQVTFSPRAAVWSTSWRPSLTMSPSPWTVNTIDVGPGPLDPGGHRRRPPVQGLEHLDVQVVGEGGVAADAEHGDGPAGRPSSCDRLEGAAHGHRLAAPRAEVVGAHVDEGRDEVVDQAGRCAGGRSVGTKPVIDVATRRPRRRSARFRMPHVEVGGDAEAGAVEAEAADELDRRPPEHGQAHVVDHLSLVVLVDGHGPRPSAARPRPRSGKGTA